MPKTSTLTISYAVICNDVIYGVGTTADSAMTDAVQQANNSFSNSDDLMTVAITPALHQRVLNEGGLCKTSWLSKHRGQELLGTPEEFQPSIDDDSRIESFCN